MLHVMRELMSLATGYTLLCGSIYKYTNKIAMHVVPRKRCLLGSGKLMVDEQMPCIMFWFLTYWPARITCLYDSQEILKCSLQIFSTKIADIFHWSHVPIYVCKRLKPFTNVNMRMASRKYLFATTLLHYSSFVDLLSVLRSTGERSRYNYRSEFPH